MDRRLFIVIAVVGFHVLGLWALQTGLLRRAVELVVPVEVLAEFIEAPQPQVTPAPPQPEPKPVQKQVTPVKPVLKQAPQPMAIADPAPSATAPAGTTEPQPPAPPMLAPVVVAEPAPPAPPKVVLPSSDAAHLNNPRPTYPPLSHRLGETGKVELRALIETDGHPSQVLLSKSSGYNRLDQAALITVKNHWRFVPGTTDGVPVRSWVVVSLNFELTE
ncbi:energy transducer TonB [Hydrogenophaga sp. A37]|uniref:energy transducer TonB n=1 Tax=Hydrogenophaga sp. A37 TaxID=1945864 RepID=UPI0009848182|nr:energy transducer TonB [Hydrogenophaga sp. A37]OOG86066.1 energy transducer TonB [Hydrogenophaga sp. A37]